MNIEDFLNMGGYARFVWPSYLLAVVVLVGNVVSALRMHSAARARALRRAGAESNAGTSAPGAGA
jgi:heme exporter protein D